MVVCTRFWAEQGSADFPRLEKFLSLATKLGPTAVAVQVERDKCDTTHWIRNNFQQVTAIPVTPWGKFVPALTALHSWAQTKEPGGLMLVASAEFSPVPAVAQQLRQQMTADHLVVGAAFSQHQFHPGEDIENATGAQVPWNTFALWNLRLLGRHGFSSAGEAYFNPAQAGVEETATIAMYQALSLSIRSLDNIVVPRALLIEVPEFGQSWDETGWSPERKADHDRRLKLKAERPAAQLHYARLKGPRVQHLAAD